MENNHITWNQYFMGIAELSAKRSKDPKTKVGCCIIDPINKHILSVGYNGLPYGMKDEDFDWNEENIGDKKPYVVHAEANAILNATQDLKDSVVYVTMFPCNECAKLLAQKKISKVIYKDDKYKYKEEGKIAIEIFNFAHISIEKYNCKE